MNIKHFYIEKGVGEPLVLLHGNGEDSSYFENQIGEFSQYYRVIALDTRGHGNTPRGSAPFRIRQFADDLADFLDRIKIKKANILGFSDGANIAMCFAAKYPDRVLKLVLNGGNLDTDGIEKDVQDAIERGYRSARLLADRSEKARKKMEILGLMVTDPNISIEELEKIESETLVIAGTEDLVKKDHSEYIASQIKNATLKFVRGDHFVAKENPSEFNLVVKSFLLKKSNNIYVRKADLGHIDSIMKIYEVARQYMINTGNDKQWGMNYPSRQLIEEDIMSKHCYICIGDDEEIHCVFMLIEGKDPTYANIDGKWLNEDPYSTIHRIASDGKYPGMFDKCIEYSKSKCNNIRIDTHEDNATMRHLIEKNGFVECGIIYTRLGDPRIAYQLTI